MFRTGILRSQEVRIFQWNSSKQHPVLCHSDLRTFGPTLATWGARALPTLSVLRCALNLSHALSVRRCAPTFSGFMSETLISLTLPTLHCNPPKAATVQDSLTFVSADARTQILLQTSSASDF